MSSNEASYGDLSDINRMVHEPARLAIMAVLAGCESCDFQFLLDTTRLSKGNLSAQTIKLSEAGYVEIEKGFNGRMPSTRYRLTPAGKQALAQYSRRLKITLDHLDQTE